MLRITLSGIAASLLAITINADLAQAQPARVFVAAQGSDANPCTFALPCRTFQHAHDTVVANGEIDVLDPAGYGTLVITKAVSIQGHGFAGISMASGSTAITINAGATDRISLRGLLLDGIRIPFTRGIRFFSGGSLDVQDCVIRNFVAQGLIFSPSATSALFVSNSHVADNGSGIGVELATGSASGALDHVVAESNEGPGLLFGGNLALIKFTVSDSVISNNNIGVYLSGIGNPIAVMMRNTVASNNGSGLIASGSNAVVRVTRSTITGNAVGFAAQSSGQIVSYSDNNLDGNTTDGAPTSTITLK